MVSKFLRAVVACLSFVALVTVAGDQAIQGQGAIVSVSTNKFTYLDTDNVVIGGSGFTQGENVSLAITQVGGGTVDPMVATPVGPSFSNIAWNPPDGLRGTFLLTATGQSSNRAAKTLFTVGLQIVVDDAGADDLSGQKDLNFLTIDYGNPGSPTITATWGWDDTAWSGNNTGDACTLFDVSNDGDADYAVCVTVRGAPAVYQSTRMYRCGPAPLFNGARTDRCTQPTLITTSIASSGAATLASPNSDPFGNPLSSAFTALHGQGNKCSAKTGAFPCVTDDVVAALVVHLNDIANQSPKLINVCSYPSQEPNSDPSDCVITPNSGFLTIRKESSPTAGTFTFNTSASAIGNGSQFSITTQADGSTFKGSKQFLSFAPTGAAGLAYVREAVPAGWTLSSAACFIDTGGTGTPTGTADTESGDGGKGVSGVEIREGLETICTFIDARDNPSLTLTKTVQDPYEGPALPEQWTLTATNDSTSAVTQFTSGQALQVPPGTYTLAESNGPAGYMEGTWDCSPHAMNGNKVTIASGETVSCSIVNTALPATLVVKKIVQNDAGGNRKATDFSIKLNGGSDNAFAQDEKFPGNDNRGIFTFTNLAPGSYTVAENQVTGYDAPIYTGDCQKVTLARGDVKECTITNNDTLATPGADTDQRVILHDSITLTGVKRGATQQAGNNQVTFRLYNSATCDAGNVAAIYTEGPIALNLANATQTEFTVATTTGYVFNPTPPASQTGSFYWRVTYSGDEFNGALTTPCGPGPNGEKTTVTLDPK